MRKLILAASVLLLAACSATIEEQNADVAALQEKLPDGCNLNAVGKTRIVDSDHKAAIFVVRCNGTPTTTTTAAQTVPEGKTTAVINNVTYELTPVQSK